MRDLTALNHTFSRATSGLKAIRPPKVELREKGLYRGLSKTLLKRDRRTGQKYHKKFERELRAAKRFF